MCCGAGVMAPAICWDWGRPGWTCDMMMGLGQGVTKAAGGDGLGQPQVRLMMLKMGPALLCQGALAGEGAAWACLPGRAG